MSLLYTPHNMLMQTRTPEPQQVVVVLGAVRDEQSRVLIARRADASVPDAQGRWEFVGGKIQFGEDPEQALVREVREESGLRVRVVRLLPKVFTHVWRTEENGELQVFLLTYECALVSGVLSNAQVADEISELRFVSLDELSRLDALPNLIEAIPYL